MSPNTSRRDVRDDSGTTPTSRRRRRDDSGRPVDICDRAEADPDERTRGVETADTAAPAFHDRPRGLSHPSRTFGPWTWNSRSARRNRRPPGLSGIGARGRDRPAIQSTCVRNGATSSPNGHVRYAARRAIARITRGGPASTARTPAASGRIGGAVERSSRPAPATPPHRSAPGLAMACTPSARTATWWRDAATRRGVRSPRAERSRAPRGTARRRPGTRISSPAGLGRAERALPCCRSSRSRWRRCSSGRCGTPPTVGSSAEHPPCSARLQCSDGEQQTAPGNPS